MCGDLAQKRGDFFDSLFVSLFGSFGLNACEKDELILFVRKIKCADKYSYAVIFHNNYKIGIIDLRSR